MSSRWKLVQTFIREATEDANFAPVADIATAYATLRTIQRGTFETVTNANGMMQVSSQIGETSFSFTLPEGFTPSDITEAAETALQLINGKTVAQARALLVRRKTTRANFRNIRH